MQLDPIGALFSKSWQRFRERFAVIGPIFLLPLVIVGIGELLSSRKTVPAMLLGVVLTLAGGIISMIASTAMIAAIGENKNFFDAYNVGFKLFWAMVWISLIASLAYFGAFVLFIIPGIMLAVQLVFIQFTLVLENKHGMASLVQSREYVKGYWWAIVGRGLLLYLVCIALFVVIELPVALLLGATAASIAYCVILLAFTPFSVCYMYEIFSNLQRLKPDASAAAEVAAKTESGFLKVCMVFGVIGFIAFIAFIIFAFAVLVPAALKQGGGEWAGTVQVSPISGPVGTMVTITLSNDEANQMDATDTILMNGYIAEQNVPLNSDDTLTFAIPSSLAPDCVPGQPCPQFALSVMPASYELEIANRNGTSRFLVDAGSFMVTTSTEPIELPGGVGGLE